MVVIVIVVIIDWIIVIIIDVIVVVVIVLVILLIANIFVLVHFNTIVEWWVYYALALKIFLNVSNNFASTGSRIKNSQIFRTNLSIVFFINYQFPLVCQ